MTAVQKILSSIAVSSSLTIPAIAEYQAGTYNVDPMHSKVGFEVAHLVISTVEGRFGEVEGQIELAKNFKDSKLSASADAKSINTGVAKRDDHLKSSDFFDVTKFPKLTLKSTAIKGQPKQFQMTADLTIKGVTKPVVFDSKYLGSVTDGYGNQKVAFLAKAKINRKDFGLSWSQAVEIGPVVGDQVSIELKIQAAKVQEQKTAQN